MKTISNEQLTIQVSPHGAELCSIFANGKEYLWQADPAFWKRHPAFYWPDFNADTQNRGFFGFDKEEGLKYILISEKGCADPSTEYSLELTDGLLPLDTHTFDKDALIIENEQIHKVTLYTKEKKAYLSLHFHAPVVGLWSPPAKNAPFVCIEPWYGRCDRAHYTGEYKDKDWMQHLQPEETFRGGYTIEIDE